MNPLQLPLPALLRTGFALLGLLLVSCSSVNVVNPKTNLELAPAPYFDNKTGIYFPGALGSLYRRPVIELEERSPGLGLAITYRNPDSRIDVFVYDLQASVIPVGIDSQVVRQSFQDAVRDLSLASKKRIYSNLQLEPESQRNIIATPFLYTRFQYDEGLEQKEGQLFVAGINSQIIKIRTTQTTRSETDFNRLLAYLGHAIDQSRRNGYGGLTASHYQEIVDQLAKIDLRDGLSASEAMAIAQIELVKQKLHNRYDLASAAIHEDLLPDSATVLFDQYPTDPQRYTDSPLAIRVNREGNATLEDNPSS